MPTPFFPSKWPIMCAIMNGVSDLNLALAVNEAGAMPSLISIGEDRLDKLDENLLEFTKCAGHSNIVVQINLNELDNLNYIKLITNYKVSHVELFGELDSRLLDSKEEFDFVTSQPLHSAGLKLLREKTQVSVRIFNPCGTSNADAYALKGSDAAGFAGKISTQDLFDQQILRTPNMPLIVYGGVGTPEQVKYYMDRGAAGIAVGTLFAASKESCLSNSTKQKMISSDSKSLVKFNTTQQALILGKFKDVLFDDTPNRQTSLDKGIAGQGGHIYAGKSIDHIHEIRSVAEIVDYLTELL